MIQFPIPLIGFAAFSGTGKTTLLRKIIPLLSDKGIALGMVKHSHHDIDIDHPGKDSYELRKAGTQQMVLASPMRTSLIIEHPEQHDSDLQKALGLLQTETLDLVLVEGFKDESFSKIELHREAMNKPFLYPDDPNIIAIALENNSTLKNADHLTQLDLNQPQEIANFIESQMIKQQENIK